MLMWKYGAHFFRNGTVILPFLPASGAGADTYPALRAARWHLRQTYRHISKFVRTNTEMRSATIPGRARAGSRPPPPRRDACPVFSQLGTKSSRAQPGIQYLVNTNGPEIIVILINNYEKDWTGNIEPVKLKLNLRKGMDLWHNKPLPASAFKDGVLGITCPAFGFRILSLLG